MNTTNVRHSVARVGDSCKHSHHNCLDDNHLLPTNSGTGDVTGVAEDLCLGKGTSLGRGRATLETVKP